MFMNSILEVGVMLNCHFWFRNQIPKEIAMCWCIKFKIKFGIVMCSSAVYYFK